ncbi:hypothetical protein DFJ63DRAFT_333125 [Scheffersomyces coipomensis]|uniref:uncharacterized protein n=1 Tax=Scheffersomyces coipomensis TaxID=1788519 RepID=UPI00315DADB8
MTEQSITFDVAESLFEDMISIIIRQQTLQALTNHISRTQQTSSIPTAQTYTKEFNQRDPNKDIFGQDKIKLKTSETSRYFPCENCGRKIAGSRYAQHINKCLDRKRKW